MSPYIQDLRRELSAVGIRGRLRERILAEFGDHLACNPDADLGNPAELAGRFADELGTARARRSAFVAFVALAVTGLLVTATLGAGQLAAGLPLGRLGPASELGLALAVVGAQVAFVSGLLGLIRALRLRPEPVLARREATFLGRRALVALISGAACLIGLALLATGLGGFMPRWWQPLALGAAALGLFCIVAASPSVLSAMRLRPASEGPAGDLFDDLGPFIPARFRGRPWLTALIIALGIGALIALAGLAQDDPFDGLARGALDAVACLTGFALLGPYLGLRHTAAR